MKAFVIYFGPYLPQWLLYVHRDPVGSRTWVEWFGRHLKIGYKHGQKIDRVWAFGKQYIV